VSYASIRSLARGLRVLQYLNTVIEATPVQICQKLDLPRPTVHRILDTLIDRGWVYQSRSTSGFRLTSEVRRLNQVAAGDKSIEALTRPILTQLTVEIAWPSDLAVRDRDAMVICDSTHRISSLSFEAGIIGRRRPMLESALGRAYLSHCPEAERMEILEGLKASPDPAAARAGDQSFIAELIEVGRRDGVSSCPDLADGSSIAIATPIRFEGRVLACINIVWLASAMPHSEAAAWLTPHLLTARNRIEERLDINDPPVLPILQ
jgi:IclR family mhp operon transcriptional activator